MSRLMEGKKGIVFGVANKRSIAWGICEALAKNGAQLALAYQNERLEKNVTQLAQNLNGACLLQCDATNEIDIQRTFEKINEKWGELDFLVHSIAFANADDLQGEYVKTSLEGFRLALEVSAYTLTSLCRAARHLLVKGQGGGSVVTMSFLGGERAIPGYNVMGIAKSALECSVRYLATDLGPSNIRVNALSAGPVNTLAARGIRDFTGLLKHAADQSPLKRNITTEEIGNAALFLLSPLASGITGEVLHVDAGYNIKGT